jgi:predicted HicB family RNase H-like nuclease
MAKKNFRNQIKGADKLFSANDDTQSTQVANAAQSTQIATDTRDVNAVRTERLSMRVPPEIKDYITEEAWKQRVSATEYICMLVRKEMENKE